jgi:hypothetical protein
VDLTSTAADWFLCMKDTIESRIIGAEMLKSQKH